MYKYDGTAVGCTSQVYSARYVHVQWYSGAGQVQLYSTKKCTNRTVQRSCTVNCTAQGCTIPLCIIRLYRQKSCKYLYSKLIHTGKLFSKRWTACTVGQYYIVCNKLPSKHLVISSINQNMHVYDWHIWRRYDIRTGAVKLHVYDWHI